MFETESSSLFERLHAPMTLQRRPEALGAAERYLYFKERNARLAFFETRQGLPVVLSWDEVNDFYTERPRPPGFGTEAA
jgi:hypothetical protein